MQVATEKVEAKELVYGNTETFLLPSGFEVTIREQNGNDDDILTNKATAQDMSNFDIFIAGIVVKTDLPFNVNGRLTVDGAKRLLLRDKYFILFKSRIHSIGKEISFDYSWSKKEKADNYTEDLTNYIWDYNETFPVEGDDNYFSERIKPYQKECYNPVVITTPSGKEIRLNLLNGIGEKFLLQLPESEQTKNKELEARNIELKNDKGVWEKIKNFTMFNLKDMGYIRKVVAEIDPSLTLTTKVENPKDQSQSDNFPILALKSFFFPEEI